MAADMLTYHRMSMAANSLQGVLSIGHNGNNTNVQLDAKWIRFNTKTFFCFALCPTVNDTEGDGIIN